MRLIFSYPLLLKEEELGHSQEVSCLSCSQSKNVHEDAETSNHIGGDGVIADLPGQLEPSRLLNLNMFPKAVSLCALECPQERFRVIL